MIWLYRLSQNGVGVKNIELALALNFNKSSVHNMLKTLKESKIVTQEHFGLIHLTNEGRKKAMKYEKCFRLLEKKISDLCGVNAITENAICGILAELPLEKIEILYAHNNN
ncbi:MAG: helix-turn-helix domain-containing protein [Ruminococcaceae bacterium]|nr:helix-turn-helix domain-containing protein [Oscillospiraceae bacterium]